MYFLSWCKDQKTWEFSPYSPHANTWQYDQNRNVWDLCARFRLRRWSWRAFVIIEPCPSAAHVPNGVEPQPFVCHGQDPRSTEMLKIKCLAKWQTKNGMPSTPKRRVPKASAHVRLLSAGYIPCADMPGDLLQQCRLDISNVRVVPNKVPSFQEQTCHVPTSDDTELGSKGRGNPSFGFIAPNQKWNQTQTERPNAQIVSGFGAHANRVFFCPNIFACFAALSKTFPKQNTNVD